MNYATYSVDGLKDELELAIAAKDLVQVKAIAAQVIKRTKGTQNELLKRTANTVERKMARITDATKVRWN